MARFINKIQDKIIALIPDNRIKVEAAIRSETSAKIPTAKIKRSNIMYDPQSHQDWIDAVALATAEEPNLYYLAELYQNLLLDAHLRATIETRIYRVTRSKFIIRKPDGEEVPELTKLFNRPWFEQFLWWAMMSKFTGIKVIELFELDNKLELKKITNIPMAHILPHKHKIVWEAGSEDGFVYNKPPMSKYYIQVGDRYDLGLLSVLAPLILAKKLSMGSWLDFIEKFGIPPVWITTDNKTTKRLKELFDMAKSLISNSYGVINTGEEIKIGDVPDTDTYKVFDEMIKRINSEVAKAILGQDATTTNKDNKGTYGSLKVMQEVANDRHESDKLFIQNIVNKELLPKLAQLSSVYAPLANLEFDWDESEQLDNGAYIERVVQLTNAGFTIDPEAVAERTGMPITGISQNPTEPNPDDGAKKKTLTPKQ